MYKKRNREVEEKKEKMEGHKGKQKRRENVWTDKGRVKKKS